jgi:hypothetical protein
VYLTVEAVAYATRIDQGALFAFPERSRMAPDTYRV